MENEAAAPSGPFMFAGRGRGLVQGGEPSLGRSLGRGTPGFWQGAFQSFMNNDENVAFQARERNDDNQHKDGQFDNVPENDVVEAELVAHVRDEDVTDFRAEGGDNLTEAASTEENNGSHNNRQNIFQRRSGGDRNSHAETGTSPSDDRKSSVKNRYDAKASQQKRREELLDMQKQRRDEILDKIRNLEAASDSELEDDEDFVKLVEVHKLQKIAEENEEPSEKMDTTGSAGRENGQRRRRDWKKPNKKRQAPLGVMLSEWLVEKPGDFNENWMGILCPVGKRCLVVASRGRTCVYSRTFEYMGVFQSHLPGGRNVDGRDPDYKKKRGVTILDCIWSMEAEVFYVLDMVCWASLSCNNCDKAYRQFFQTSKIAENPTLMERQVSNPYPFLPLPSFDCSHIAVVMMTSLPIFKQKVDGVLFFHKESFYFNGVNPLCLWIYLTDVEEKLQVSVAPELVALQRTRARTPRPQVTEGRKNGGNGSWRKDAVKQKPMEVQAGA